MSRAITLAALVAITSTGCFTTWAGTQIAGVQNAWEQDAREESVPLPGITERLTITLPLEVEHRVTANATAAAIAGEDKPFALGCDVNQYARNEVTRSAFRYGSKWKLAAGMMFLAEAALATAFYVDRDNVEHPEYALYAGFFGLDAIGTAAIFFIPRKEVFRSEERPVTTHIRNDCPEGLTLEIAGETFPVDAAGKLGELGEAALDEWMTTPSGSLLVSLHGRTNEIRISPIEQCAWQRSRGTQGEACQRFQGAFPQRTMVNLDVPAGTLTLALAQ